MKFSFKRLGVLLCVALICVVSLVPSASAAVESLYYSISLDNADWVIYQPGEDGGFTFDYNGVTGTIPFNVRFSRTIGIGYDYLEWVIYTEVVTIDSISAYSSVTESALPIEVSYLDGKPSTDHNGDTGFPVRRLISIVIDCTSLDWANEDPYLRIYGTYLSDGREGQQVTVWGLSGYNLDDVVTPEVSWLEKIWNSMLSGFSSTGQTLTNIYNSIASGFGSVISFLTEIRDAIVEGPSNDGLDNSSNQMQSSSGSLAGQIGGVSADLGSSMGDVNSAIGSGSDIAAGLVASDSMSGTLVSLASCFSVLFVGNEINICGLSINPMEFLVTVLGSMALIMLIVGYAFRKRGGQDA